MIITELIKRMRFYIDQAGGGVIRTSVSDARMDDVTLLQEGFREYAKRTKAYPVDYTLAATAGTAIYSCSDFGVVGEAVGTGIRIFELDFVAFNGHKLKRTSRSELDQWYSEWRSAGNGTPSYWLPWGSQRFRIYSPPSGTDSIYIEGWETPDMADFADPTDTPLNVPDIDQPLIAIWGAIMATVSNPNDENSVRQSSLWPIYKSGIVSASGRVNSCGNERLQLGKHASRPISGLRLSDTITNLP